MSNRKVDILRGPPYLLFQLVRFHQENGKERRPLIINETLSLVSRSYQLCAAILHKGTPSAGHYLNLLKEATNQWVVLDDETVVVAVDDSLTHEMLKQWAYLVLYKATDLVRKIKDSQGPSFTNYLTRQFYRLRTKGSSRKRHLHRSCTLALTRVLPKI